MKIAVIGYSGAGKSTLSKRLSKLYGCPLLYLDTVNFESGWKERDREEGRAIVEAFMKNKSWVIDGNYMDFYQEKRLKEADKIIFMNFPRRICFVQALKRYFTMRNKTRESMTIGCNEKFDFEFAKWILRDGRSKKYQERYKAICTQYKNKVSICKNRKDVETLIRALEEKKK